MIAVKKLIMCKSGITSIGKFIQNVLRKEAREHDIFHRIKWGFGGALIYLSEGKMDGKIAEFSGGIFS